MLDAEYITAAEQRARQFSGAYTGTSGTLAADVIRLLKERQLLMATTAELETRNAELRAAVESRLAGTPADDPKMVGYTPMAASLAGCKPAEECASAVLSSAWQKESCCEGGKRQPPEVTTPPNWILQGQQELEKQRLRGDGVLNAGDETYSEWVPAFRSPTIAQATLNAAMQAVGDRHQKYGPPTEHFARTAAMVNAAFGTTFTPSDWALVMVLDKVARLRGPTPTTDGGVDIAGYGACYEETRQAQP